MSALAFRPLTFLAPAMLAAAMTAGATIYAQRSRCGRYWLYQAHTAPPPAWGGWQPVADADDVRAWVHAYGGDVAGAGRAIVDAFTRSGVQ